jgi:hypothetical protein
MNQDAAEQQVSEDDWAAAMNEQAATARRCGGATGTDLRAV